MKEMKKRVIFSLVIVLIVVSIFGSVSAEILVSDAGVEYDSQILDEFSRLGMNETNNQTLVRILFYLKNSSDADNLLSNFSEGELRNIIRRSISIRIGGEITEQGFNKLISDSRVKVVYFNAPISGDIPSITIMNDVEVDSRIYNAFENSYEWVQIIIEVDSKTSINDIISPLQETEFKFIREMMFSEAFVAEITEQGLESLINDAHVNKISFDKIAYTTEDENIEWTENGQEDTKIKRINLWAIIIPIFVILLIIIYTLFYNKKS